MLRERSPKASCHLEQLASLIEVKEQTARLLPVAERTRSLFQKGDAAEPIGRGKAKEENAQLSLGFVAISRRRKRALGWGDTGAPHKGETVSDPRSPVYDSFVGARPSAKPFKRIPGRRRRRPRRPLLAACPGVFCSLIPHRRMRSAGSTWRSRAQEEPGVLIWIPSLTLVCAFMETVKTATRRRPRCARPPNAQKLKHWTQP